MSGSEDKNKINIMTELAGQVRNLIKNKKEETSLSLDNFFRIVPETLIHNISFIDGGNSELLSTPSFCLSLIKISAERYKLLEHEETLSSSFYVIVICNGEEFIASTIAIEDNLGINIEKTKFPIVHKGRQQSAGDITNIVRRYLELNTLKKLALDNSKQGQIIILDGHLESDSAIEERLLKEISEIADKNNSLIASLAKKTTMLMKNGDSIISRLLMNAPKGEWYYPLQASKNLVKTTFMKLQDKSEFVFKFQTRTANENIDFQRIANTLAKHSTDAVFPGYPYGLIKADHNARVSNQETAYQRTLLISELGDDWPKLKSMLDLPDAHKILDIMRY